MAELIRRQKDELVQWYKEKGQRAFKAFSEVILFYFFYFIFFYFLFFFLL